jgi:hypothetical protein
MSLRRNPDLRVWSHVIMDAETAEALVASPIGN